TGAWESLRACRSVFAAMNSTPSTLARIMRFTALQPPPPTPITFSLAGCCSSLKLIRIPASFAVMLLPLSGWSKSFIKLVLSRFHREFLRAVENPPIEFSRAPLVLIPRDHCNLAPTLSKPANCAAWPLTMAQRRPFLLESSSHEHGLQLRNEVARTLLCVPPRLRGIQHKPNGRGVLGLGNLFRQILDTPG